MDYLSLEDEIVAWIMFFGGGLLTCVYSVRFLHFTPSGLGIVLDGLVLLSSVSIMFIGVEGIFNTGMVLEV